MSTRGTCTCIGQKVRPWLIHLPEGDGASGMHQAHPACLARISKVPYLVHSRNALPCTMSHLHAQEGHMLENKLPEDITDCQLQ